MIMLNEEKTSLYLLCLFFFKVAVGAILLVIGWDSLSFSKDWLVNVCIVMALSFSPAAFARPLFQKFSKIFVPRLITCCLWIAGFIFLIEWVLISNRSIWLFFVHFLLWIFIFIIEVAGEKWYVQLSQGHDIVKIRKLSGLSTSVGQIGIIIGPIIVMLAKHQSEFLPYPIIIAIFIGASIFSLRAQKYFKTAVSNNNPVELKKTALDKRNNEKFWYTFSYALIWPTLTIFNISIPILAKFPIYNSINVAGFLEILMALATAVAGFAHPYITKTTKNIFSLSQAIIIFFVLLCSLLISYIYQNNIFFLCSGIFLLGMSYVYLRVELRAHLSRRFEPQIGGKIIATANSWSGLLVILYTLLFYFNANIGKPHRMNISFLVSFLFSAIVFVFVLHFSLKELGRDNRGFNQIQNS
jgi:hypothetical protein